MKTDKKSQLKADQPMAGAPKIKLNLTPTAGYVLVEPVDVQKQTDSGIYLPDSHDEKPQEGVVLAVGDTWVTEHGAKITAPCHAGQKVIYKKWGGNDVKIANKEYQFLKFEDILAIVLSD